MGANRRVREIEEEIKNSKREEGRGREIQEEKKMSKVERAWFV